MGKREIDDAVELALLKKDVAELKEERNQCKGYIKSAIREAVILLIMASGSGWFLGWHIPEETRKALIEWLTK